MGTEDFFKALADLTPAEIELIKAKREEAEKEKARKEAEHEKKVTEAKEKLRVRIERYKKEALARREAEDKFLAELGEGWSRTENTYQKVAKIDTTERNEEGNHVSVILAEETYDEVASFLVKGDYKVYVRMHTVFNDSNWRGSYREKGYKMYLEGPDIDFKQRDKAYSRAKTVNEKIDEIVRNKQAKAEAERKEGSFIGSIVSNLTIRFPEAKITPFKEYEYYEGYGPYGKRAVRSPEKRSFISIDLPNKIKIKLKVYTESVELSGITYPTPTALSPSKDLYEFVKAYSRVTFSF